jgi:hypothetical protein
MSMHEYRREQSERSPSAPVPAGPAPEALQVASMIGNRAFTRLVPWLEREPNHGAARPDVVRLERHRLDASQRMAIAVR